MKRLVFWCALLGACGGSGNATGMHDGAVASGDAGTSNDAGASGDAGGPSDAESLCVKTINDYRATLGLAAYTRWNAEEACADGQAKSDSMSGTAHGAFGTCNELAQDECPGWPGPPSDMIGKCLAQMWAEGPGSDFSTHGHYINMSSTSYTQVSCGFYTLGDGSVWAVQDFK